MFNGFCLMKNIKKYHHLYFINTKMCDFVVKIHIRIVSTSKCFFSNTIYYLLVTKSAKFVKMNNINTFLHQYVSNDCDIEPVHQKKLNHIKCIFILNYV